MYRYINSLKMLTLCVTMLLAPLSGLAVEPIGDEASDGRHDETLIVAADHDAENSAPECQDQGGSHSDHGMGHCCVTPCAGPVVDILSHAQTTQSPHLSLLRVEREYLCVNLLFRPPKNLSLA